MGLDITAYTNVEKVAPELYKDEQQIMEKGEFYEFCWDKGWYLFWTQFPQHAKDMEVDVPYSSSGQSFGFRAGSYGSYNRWRNRLAVLAGYESAEDVWEMEDPWGKPFVELINFSDCEGIIGFELCKKLAADFIEYRGAAVKFSEENGFDEYFMLTYDHFSNAFVLARDEHGIIYFH